MVDETSRLKVEVDATAATRSIESITRQFERLQRAVGRTSSAFMKFGRSLPSRAMGVLRSTARGMFNTLRGGINIVKRLGSTFLRVFKSMAKIALVAAGLFAAFSRSVLDTGNKMNKFVNTLVILKGNTKDAVEELKLLFEISQKLGTSFTAAAAPFTKFAAAAAGSLSDQGIRDVFEAFATVGVALQLTQSEVTGVFLALQQIASKGVVSMEELRLQLAERVPGAMKLAASSMDMSMRRFEIAVRDRTINAGVFLERFAAKLKATFGLAAELASQRLFAGIQRLGNAFVLFRQRIFESGFEEGLKNLVQSATDFLTNNPELATALGQFAGSIFNRVADFIDSLSSDKVVSFINTIINAFESLINAINRFVFAVQKMFGGDTKTVVEDMQDAANEFNAAIDARNEANRRLAGGGTVREENTFRPDTFRAMTPTEFAEAISTLDRLDGDIIEMRGHLLDARSAARDLGLELGSLPQEALQKLVKDDVAVGPAQINLPRIEPTGGTVDLALLSQPPISGNRPATDDALEQAERLTTIDAPKFYTAIIEGEIRAGLEDLVRVQGDLLRITLEQDKAIGLIMAAEFDLDVLRKSQDPTEDASELETAIRLQAAAMEEFNTKERERLELKNELLKLQERETAEAARLLTFQQDLERTFTSTRDVMINALKKTEDAIVELVTTGKASFSDLANSIIADLTRMAIQAFITRFILGPLIAGFSDRTGSALGGTFNLSSPGTQRGLTLGHTGGVVGQDRLQTRSAFENLKSNERPIIVKTGEGIFTEQQMAALAPVSDMMRSISRGPEPQMAARPPVVNVTAPSTQIQIINNTGEETQVEKSRGANGDELVRLVIGVVDRDINNDGVISRSLKGKFGLRNTTGLR